MTKLLIFVFGIFLTVGIFSYQFVPWTEMLVYPYLLNHGFLLYSDLISPYPPLILWFLQAIEYLFGSSVLVVQVLTVLLFLISLILIYYFSLKIHKKRSAAIVSVMSFGIWWFYFEGYGLWFELVMTPLILVYFYLLYSSNFKNLLKFGLVILTILVLSKQSSLYLAIPLIVRLFKERKNFDYKALFQGLLMSSIIFGMVIIGFLLAGNLAEAFEWVVKYAFWYFPTSPGHNQWPTISDLMKLAAPMLVIFGIRGLSKSQQLIIVSALGATFMFAIPRYGLFHLTAFLSIIMLMLAPRLVENFGKNRLIYIIGLIWIIVIGRDFYRHVFLPTRFFEPEVYKMAEQVKGLEVCLFNSADQIYLINRTLPPKPYVQNFAWYFEYQDLQQRVKTNFNCQYVLYTEAPGDSMEIGHYLPKTLNKFILDNYSKYKQINDVTWIYKHK